MKKKNKLAIIIVLILTLFVTTACDKKEEKVVSNGQKVNTNKMAHKHCSREAQAEGGADVSLNYDLYYTGEVLNLLVSSEKITSAKDETLDAFENAYNKIKENYTGLEYYDQEVIRDEISVNNKITINYDKIDIDKLIAIEGEEDNIFENKVPKVEKWLTLLKKFGGKCEDVE